MWAVFVRCWAANQSHSAVPGLLVAWAVPPLRPVQSWATAGSRHQAAARATCDQSSSVTSEGTLTIHRASCHCVTKTNRESHKESLQWAVPQSPGEATGASCKCFLSCNYSNLVESSQCNHDSNCVFLKSRFPN